MKEIAGFDLTETGFLFYNKLQENIIDKAGYDALRKFSQIESVGNLLGLTTEQISRIFEKTTILGNRDFYRMKSSKKLLSLCRRTTKRVMNEYGYIEKVSVKPILSRSKIEHAVLQSSCGLLGPVTRKTRILSPSMFDRVFTVIVSPDQFSIDSPGTYRQAVVYRRSSDDFDISGYFCEVELGE